MLIVASDQVKHEAVLETAWNLCRDGWELTELEVDLKGLVDFGRHLAALCPDTRLVSVMLTNSEVEPVSELAQVVGEHSPAPFQTDATQALGKVLLDVAELGVDLLTIAAHKVGEPKGVGVLFVRHGVTLDPVITGAGRSEAAAPRPRTSRDRGAGLGRPPGGARARGGSSQPAGAHLPHGRAPPGADPCYATTGARRENRLPHLLHAGDPRG